MNKKKQLSPHAIGRWCKKILFSASMLTLVGMLQPAYAINEEKKQMEHMAAMALASVEDATHASVQSGPWSDPATWGGALPTAGARVHIAAGHDVIVDGQFTERLMTVRVDGTLRFASYADTELSVDTLITSESSLFEMGTETNPIAKGVTARIIIDDYNNGFETADTLSPDYDPFKLGQGIIAHGRFVMHGAEKTSYGTVNEARIGDTSLALDELPGDWEVGDTIVIAGTVITADGDEVRTIADLDKATNTVHLNAALAKDHVPPPHNKAGLELKVHVANVTRNAKVETAEGNRAASGTTSVPPTHSKDPNPIVGDAFDGRGHIMFMHTNDVDVRYGEFLHLGRTNKRIPVNDTQVDESGNITHIGQNPRARYPIHFHRSGPHDVTPAIVHGSAVFDGPGWGYVNHGGFVVMSNNVAYNIDGASFVTERGDERGAFVGNLSIKNQGDSQGLGRGVYPLDDFGHKGHGFWTQGPLIFLRNNIVAGAKDLAFENLNTGIDGVDPKRPAPSAGGPVLKQYFKFPEELHLDDIDIVQSEIKTLPFNEHTGNMAYGSGRAIHFNHYHPGRSFHHYGEVKDFTAYNVGYGIQRGYATAIRLTNLTLINDPSTPGEFGTENVSMLVNPHIEGFLVGISTAVTTSMGDLFTSNGTIFGTKSGRYVEGGYLNNLINVVVNGFHGSASEQTSIRNVTYGQMTPEQVAIASAAFQAYNHKAIARNVFDYSVMEVGATSMADFVPTQQINVHYLVHYREDVMSRDLNKPKGAFQPRRYSVEVDGFVYELMAKREQHADFVPVPSWRFPIEEGFVGPGFDLIRDKTNAELHAMSVADREAMIIAVHGEIETGDLRKLNHPQHKEVEFPGWQYVQGGYVLPADWQSNPDYIDGDIYGMENVVLKKMKDELGNDIAVTWQDSGVVAADDIFKYEPTGWYPWGLQPISKFITNDTDPDWRAYNPHNQAFFVHHKYGEANQGPHSELITLVNLPQPRYGKAHRDSSGIKYYPVDGFVGIDPIRYHVADLTGKDAWATAYLFVGMEVDESLVNYVPEAFDDEYTVARGEAAMLDVLANDTDPEGGVLTIEKVGFPERNTDVGKPHFGTAEIVNGQIRYTPNGYFTGTDRFVYYAKDDAGNLTRRGTVTVNVEKSAEPPPVVNNAPEAVDDIAETDQDTVVTVDVLANDTDADGDLLSVTAVTNGANGSTLINLDSTVSYTPNTGFSGTDSFGYTVSDGYGGEATAAVHVTVHADRTALVVEYTFDDGTASDTSPYGMDNSGTLLNGAWVDNGVLTLDGVDDVVAIADSVDINMSLTQQRTISLRFNANDVGGRQVLYEEGGNSRGLNIYIDNGLLYIGGWNKPETGWTGSFRSTPVSAGQWYTITLVLDGTDVPWNGAFRGYLNGELAMIGVGSELHARGNDTGLGGIQGNTLFHDGVMGSNTATYFNGRIDDFRLYNRALSEAEI